MAISKSSQHDTFQARLNRISTGTVMTQCAEAEGTNPNVVYTPRRIKVPYKKRFLGLMALAAIWIGAVYLLQSNPTVRGFAAMLLPEDLIVPVARYGGLAVFNYLCLQTVFTLRGVGGAPKLVMLVTAAVLNIWAFAPPSLTDPEQIVSQYILPHLGGLGAIDGLIPANLKLGH